MTAAELPEENYALRRQLEEAEEALRALGGGAVDGVDGPQISSRNGTEKVCRLAVETLAVGAVHVTPDGIVLFCNASFCGLVGLASSALLGTSIRELLAPNDRDAFAELLKRCLRAPVKQRVVFIRSDGHPTPVLLSGAALSMEEEITLFLLAADLPDLDSNSHQIEALNQSHRTAIASLEQTQAALQQAERVTAKLKIAESRFRALVEAAANVTYRMTPDWQRMEYLAGLGFFDDGEAASRTWLEKYIPWDEQPRVLMTINEAIRSQSMFDLEHRVLQANGSTAWWHSRAIPVLNASGEVVEWLGTSKDITLLKQAEALQREQAERFQRIFEKAATGIEITDLYGRFEQCNPAYAALLGYSQDELLQLSAPLLIHPDDHFACVQATERLLGGAVEEFEIEHRYVRKDGQAVWVRKFVSLLTDGKGYPAHILALVTDITERRQAEAQLRDLNATLELRVAEQTAALQASEELNRRTLQALPAHIAVLAADGRIIAINQAWQDFAIRNCRDGSPALGVGTNYLDVCRKAAASDDESRFAATALTGIETVMTGQQAQFTMIYPCHDPEEQRWFLMTAVPADDTGASGAVIAHLDITEQKQVEAALRDRNTFLRLAMEAALVTAFEWDVVNDRMHRFNNVEGSVDRLEHVLYAVHPDDRVRLRADIEQALASKDGRFRSEFRRSKPDGSSRWLVETGRVSFDERQRPARLMGISQDITERKLTEAALRTSEERLRLAVEGGRMGLWAIDLQTEQVIADEVSRQLFDLSAESAGDLTNWIGRLHPRDIERVKAAWADGMESFAGKQIEYRVVHSDGSIRWLHTRWHFHADAASQTRQATGLSFDITLRKQNEAALLWHARRDALLSETSARLLASSDPRHVVEALCEKVMAFLDCQVFFCYLLDETTGRLNLATYAGLSAEQARTIQWLESSGCATSSAHSPVTAVGREVSELRVVMAKSFGIEALCSHPLQSQTRLIGQLVFGRQSRPSFTASEVDVARMVADLIAVALHRVEAEHALREADRRKDEFVAMLAHELRNPLVPICNAVEVLQHKSADARLVEWVGGVLARNVQHMVRLVDELLDVSRITQGKITLQRSRFELWSVFRHAIEQSRHYIEERHHLLAIDLPSEPAYVVGDPVRLVQVFANLLINAAKFTPNTGQIELSAKVAENRVKICIQDNGVGIDPDLQPHIFELFRQEHRDSDQAQGGLGIGLTLVKSLVELHGGEVGVYSPGRDQGTVFTVWLPTATPDDELPAEERREAPRRGTPNGAVSVLLVEDNEDVAESMAVLLRLRGYSVATVGDGFQAMDHVLQFAPAVVMLDIGLPGMDGRELAGKLREMPGGREKLIVALTGYDQPIDGPGVAPSVFDAYFVKPADVDELCLLIDAHGASAPAHPSSGSSQLPSALR